jgi:hypothetical protein
MTEVFFFRAKLSEILVALEIGSKLYLFVFFAKGEVILSAIREIREQRERKGEERIQVEQIFHERVRVTNLFLTQQITEEIVKGYTMYRMTSRNAGQAKTKQGEIKRERKGRECQPFVFLLSPFSPFPDILLPTKTPKDMVNLQV